MSELSIMCDESDEWGKLSEYYLITLVFHDQSDDLGTHIAKYEAHLGNAGLPDIAFHAGPLLNGHGDYEGMPMRERKRLLVAFLTLVRNMPFTYVTFAHKKSEFDDNRQRFEAQLKRDLADYLLSHLERFQTYGTVKVYYDNGHVVTDALKSSISYALSKEEIVYRETCVRDYRLEQSADLLCTLELTVLKYAANTQTATDLKIFGNARAFKMNYLKAVRKKLRS
ncbi:hypothetical protein [Bifidobacterium crudilactis]|uniref:hypothetical protein n=1 Tax=Bifidobacterium crudilactis TaxID=327277 RepID=UPI0023563273|nr:hypothetical protein [Bifidobacterium crudilactis]MCI1218785.1 hypothetical protein [Bifidobacterium crudilactis]